MRDHHSDLESVVRDSYVFHSNTAAYDLRCTEMIQRASATLGKINLVREYQDFMDTVNTTTANENKRAALLQELQRENNLIKALQEENRQLKENVTECMDTLEQLTLAHRNLRKRIENDKGPVALMNLFGLLQALSEPKNEGSVKDPLKNLVDELDNKFDADFEGNVNADIEKYAMIRKEHITLRELLKYACIAAPETGRFYARAAIALDRRRIPEPPVAQVDE